MSRSLRSRLALSYLAVILVGMAIITPLAWLAVERLYLNTQSASLLAQAQLVAAALGNETPAPADPIPYSQTSNTVAGAAAQRFAQLAGILVRHGSMLQPGARCGLGALGQRPFDHRVSGID